VRPTRPPESFGIELDIGKNSAEFSVIPARFGFCEDGQPILTTDWELSAAEMASIMAGGRIRIHFLSRGTFTPMHMSVVEDGE